MIELSGDFERGRWRCFRTLRLGQLFLAPDGDLMRRGYPETHPAPFHRDNGQLDIKARYDNSLTNAATQDEHEAFSRK